jgi:parallel beta-helix repeat protein
MSATISQARGGGTRGVWLGGALFGALVVAILLAAPTRARELAPRVSYIGPARLVGPVTLRANATAGRDRVVAVTFFLDDRPLGSDTTAPYQLDLDAGLLRPGSHRLRIVAADNLGRRGSTQPITVRTAGPTGKILRTSPRRVDAALAALRRGHVTVRLGPGRYVLKDVRLASGSRLLGAGARTVITSPRGEGYFALLVARGRNIRISDLVLDGRGPGEGEGSAVAIFDGSSNVRLQRLQIKHVRKSGVLIWGAHSDISIQDSRIEGSGAGRAGVAALGSDRSSNVSVIRTRVRGFRDYGILFAQREFGRPAAALHALALDNHVSEIADPDRAACATRPETAGCGTNESGIWSGGVEATIFGNRIRSTGWTGIETVGSSTRTTIVANDIRTTRTGIYLEHSTNYSLILRNVISKVRTGINVEWLHDGVGSTNNVFAFNRVSAATSGLFADVGADRNSIVGNVFVGGARPAIILQGSSNNVVQGNRGCGTESLPIVREQTARWQDGRPAQASGNLILGNQSVRVCRAP